MCTMPSNYALSLQIKRIKIAEPKDFDEFREMVSESTPGFELKSDKKGVKVWAKIIEGNPIRQIKVCKCICMYLCVCVCMCVCMFM